MQPPAGSHLRPAQAGTHLAHVVDFVVAPVSGVEEPLHLGHGVAVAVARKEGTGMQATRREMGGRSAPSELGLRARIVHARVVYVHTCVHPGGKEENAIGEVHTQRVVGRVGFSVLPRGRQSCGNAQARQTYMASVPTEGKPMAMMRRVMYVRSRSSPA
jgi:hypothetical protein